MVIMLHSSKALTDQAEAQEGRVTDFKALPRVTGIGETQRDLWQMNSSVTRERHADTTYSFMFTTRLAAI